MNPDEFIQSFKEKHGAQFTKDGQLIRDMNDKELMKRVLRRYPGERSNIIGLDSYLSDDERKELPPESPTSKKLAEGWQRLSESVGRRVANGWQGAADKAQESVERGAQRFSEAPDGSTVEGQVKRTGALLETGLGVASAGVQGIFAPLTALIEEGMAASGADKALAENEHVQAIAKWAEENPDLARNLGDAFNVATAGLGAKIGAPALDASVEQAGKAALDATVDAGTTAMRGAKTAITDTSEALADGAAGAKAKLLRDQVDGLEQRYVELANTTSKTRNKLNRAQKVTDLKNRAGTTGQTPERVLAENGIIPKQDGGRLVTSEQADEFRASTEALRQAARDAIREVEHSVPKTALDELESRALQFARSERNVDAGNASAMVKEIEAAFDEYRAAYGDAIPLSKVDDIKAARWADTKFDSSKPLKSDVNYTIAKAMQEAVEETAAKAGFEDVAQLNRHIGDRLEAASFLDSLDGKVVKGGRLQRYVFMGIGATLGNTLPAKILGALGGDAVANLLISNSVAGPVKRLILRNLETKDPAAYTAAIKWLEEQDLLKETRAKLPEGQGSYPNNGKPIPLPEKAGDRRFETVAP